MSAAVAVSVSVSLLLLLVVVSVIVTLDGSDGPPPSIVGKFPTVSLLGVEGEPVVASSLLSLETDASDKEKFSQSADFMPLPLH